ncbi:unnamed protein product [Schistosoma curassoni]|uniref:Uncharacterized protein n=1 Tax=Schistosoma curassoni TaxID=6186 RepID=A0A183K7V1_9TREM|nr:unnamed protein product [Schistosoma curassoni]
MLVGGLCSIRSNRRKPVPLNPPDNEAPHTDLPIDVTPPTIEEMRMSIRQVRSRKAVGPDNIPVEAMKSDRGVTANMLHALFRKKRDLSKCANYRSIALLSVPRNVSNSVAEPDERSGRRPTPRSTGRIP